MITSSIKSRLIIISDLWGIKRSDWLQEYRKILETVFQIHIYDSCSLGEIDVSQSIEKDIHDQFIQRGIKTAVNSLLEKEKKKVNILALSIGGTIAWKAALEGLDIDTLYTVSSTRLRYELETPNCKVKCYFGAEDKNIPDRDWFQKRRIKPIIYKEKNHQLYTDTDFMHRICNEIIVNTLKKIRTNDFKK
ncbi:alpha/beta hydrolase [Aquimarina sp. RZ0]|uniref:alpha/beta hydrolase n=1 Tax=Aquimarina sp. RZ0 TaxID=2607730 RepID=UPI0011F3977D|nr:alpha/beta hydrolase [Aquimarina sp. RZ0]KAA1245265.1 alpha/beta hydrolase [Aquimarina sp. RZ0]